MTFDIGLHEVCVRVGVLYVITKFSRMDSLPNFVTHGAPLSALRAHEGSANKIVNRSKFAASLPSSCNDKGYIRNGLKNQTETPPVNVNG